MTEAAVHILCNRSQAVGSDIRPFDSSAKKKAPQTGMPECPGEGTFHVACSDGVLFSCPVGENQLAVCLNADAATYSFGPHGQPELVLTESFVTLDYHPWVGMGRWEQNSVSFTNGDYEYRVSAARDRLDDERQELWEVCVTVSWAGESIARLTCENTFYFNVLEVLWSRKLQMELCWSRTEWSYA